MPHQVAWIQAEKAIHNQRKQAMALAEKSVRIGWTYADAFKMSASASGSKTAIISSPLKIIQRLEYIRQCYKFAESLN